MLTEDERLLLTEYPNKGRGECKRVKKKRDVKRHQEERPLRTDGEQEVESGDVVTGGGRPAEKYVGGGLRVDRRGGERSGRVRRAEREDGERGARQRPARTAGGHTHDGDRVRAGRRERGHH